MKKLFSVFAIVFVCLGFNAFGEENIKDLKLKKIDILKNEYKGFIDKYFGLKEGDNDSFGNIVFYDYYDLTLVYQIYQAMPNSSNQINSSVVNQQLDTKFIEIEKYYDNFLTKIFGEPISDTLKGKIWEINGFTLTTYLRDEKIKYGNYKNYFYLTQNIYSISIKNNNIDKAVLNKLQDIDDKINQITQIENIKMTKKLRTSLFLGGGIFLGLGCLSLSSIPLFIASYNNNFGICPKLLLFDPNVSLR